MPASHAGGTEVGGPLRGVSGERRAISCHVIALSTARPAPVQESAVQTTQAWAGLTFARPRSRTVEYSPMKPSFPASVFIGVFALLHPNLVGAENWSQFRGPKAAGV